jgi:hypothetical protein
VTISKDELERLANTLEVPSSFLVPNRHSSGWPLFRKRAIRSARRVSGIQARLNVAVLIAQRLLDAGVDLDAPQRFPNPVTSHLTNRR